MNFAIFEGTPTHKTELPVTHSVPVSAHYRFSATQNQGPELLYGSLQHGSYDLQSPPIALVVAEREGKAVVIWDDAAIEVSATTLGEALEILRKTIVGHAAPLLDKGLLRKIA